MSTLDHSHLIQTVFFRKGQEVAHTPAVIGLDLVIADVSDPRGFI